MTDEATGERRMPAEERRRELVAAAFRVMAREGIAAASTRAIVAEAGMPLGAFHYCFRSKQELLRELMTSSAREAARAAVTALRPGLDVLGSLRDGFLAYWQVIEAEPAKQMVLHELTQYALRQPELADLPRWEYESYVDETVRYLRAVGDNAGAEWTLPERVLARMVVTVTDGVTLGWLADRDSDAALAALEAFARQFASLSRPRAPRRGEGRARGSRQAR
ncbi:TetR/AcrR family transcriptional regulator [Streptoalloteichus hindustanus]|uniref:Transcriptional regulator, TetR family n=1 Tax=Streptoalloteichus hindustanus TaxID=2017 RepID=A0A1M5EYK6_STRHI|nr:TetR/AcrR family transcriptional regulator [Streptoalloteichus hindustanus]SHF84122.1 transcriptional regulator, TetR family [Streptoalloteichus hindustanus]